MRIINKMETIEIIAQEYDLINLRWHGMYALALINFSAHMIFFVFYVRCSVHIIHLFLHVCDSIYGTLCLHRHTHLFLLLEVCFFTR